MSRYHGGWLAPNIYYLGAAGCVDVGGIRIAGVSGIYHSNHYRKGKSAELLARCVYYIDPHLGHHERIPYNSDALRSIYHVRRYDITKLAEVGPFSSLVHLA